VSIFLGKLKVNKPLFIFLLSVGVFAMDNVVNAFGSFPVFSTFSLIIIPLIWLQLWSNKKLNSFLIAFASVFVGAFLSTGFVYGFHQRSISDLIFILFFASSYFYYQSSFIKATPKWLHIFTVVVMLLFSFAFAGINSQSYTASAKEKKTDEYNAPKKVKHDNDVLDVMEYKRNYHYGLFRIPHVASYFLGFLALFYGYLFFKSRKWYLLLISILLFVLMLYSGVRTFAFVLAIAAALYFFRKRYLRVSVILILAVILMFLFRYKFFFLTRGSILEPFTSLIITITDNIDRLSRVLIWKSWLIEMQKFSWYNFLIGKSFYGSIEANARNLHNPLWFHNDFFSIVYSYGIPALAAYIVFFLKIYKDHENSIRKNFFLFVFNFSMPLAAFINGMYYYFPVLILYLFFVMMGISTNGKEEIKTKDDLLAHEV